MSGEIEGDSSSVAASCLNGGGEMGALMRAFDWSKTPLGSVSNWSPSLRITVSILLASRFPLQMLWGPEYIQFYNDAYRPILGAKHPDGLGQRGEECWEEVWDWVSPMLDRVRATGEASWSENQLLPLERNGYVEECYFTFSYSPIRQETGEVGGIFIAVTETTQTILSDRRQRLLSELAARALDARTPEEACAIAAKTLSGNVADIPFALIYLLDRTEQYAQLTNTIHLEANTAAIPCTLNLNTSSQSALWSIAKVVRCQQAIRVESLELPFGNLPERNSALILPLTTPGQERVAGCLVLGISPQRALDQTYQQFFEAIAGHIATAIANARSLEDERKHTQAQLKFHANILAEVSDVVLALDRDLRITYWNRAAERFYQVTADAAIGRLHHEVFQYRWPNPNDEKTAWKALASAKSWSGELIHIKRNGEERYVEATVNLLRQEGALNGYLAVVRDISDRKRIEEALLISDVALQQMPDAILLMDLEGRIQQWTGKATQIFGYSAEEAIGQSVSFLHQPDVQEIMTAHIIQSIQATGDYLGEVPCQRKDGSFVPIETTAKIVYDTTGHPLFFVSINRDITERKQAEAERTQLIQEQARRTEAERAEQRATFLAEASAVLASSLDYEQTLNSVVRLIVPVLADYCLICRLKTTRELQLIAATHHLPQKESLVQEWAESLCCHIDCSDSLMAQVLQTGKPILIAAPSAAKTVGVVQHPHAMALERALNPASLIILPLSVRGQVLGVMVLARAESGRCYEAVDLSLSKELAWRAAIAIDTALLYWKMQQARDMAERAADRTARLQSITAALSESLTQTQVAEVIAEQGLTALGSNLAMVALLKQNKTELEVVHSIGCDREQIEAWQQFSINAAVPLAEAARKGQPIWEELVEDRIAHYPHLAEEYARNPHRAWISLPFVIEGQSIGAISLGFDRLPQLSNDDRAFMLALAQQSAQAIARARLYEAEQQARAEAEAANRVKDEFLAVLSHELRTPLNPILGWTKLLRQHNLDEARTAMALETIERNAKLQTQLIEDLLDVSRILQGKLNLNVAPVDLATMIQSAIETVRLAAEAKSIQIHTHFDATVERVAGDSNRLQQVIWNLLSNAVKFTPAGGRVDVKLEKQEFSDMTVEGTSTQPSTLHAHRPRRYAQITVKDTGKGIDPGFLPHVFKYFHQADSATTRAFGGLGIGLAIAQQLVELHGGTIEAASSGEGQGATFTVNLPVMQEAQPETARIDSPEITPDLNGAHVLIVDDDPDMREFLAFTLQQYGAIVTAVTSAAQAIAALVDQPDILLSDIGMPNVNGYMLIRQIRELPPAQGGTIPAIALTAYAGELNQKQALAAGFQQHLAKPVEPETLVKAIVTLVKRSNPNTVIV
ncbi:PAS domain S-box protein [Oculatella sp. LEGE 06141]|uniref:PAS domain S-box protein n=1 Tax=Oculatella sp. LEGE 06141 TaxID=1828648 RepID=UPI00187E408C|nr:PAS domain S-box protein [Oculatella sp. LEGE 06141]MBE9182125.1 PAS domain S-box protein [Oculatella sp. LEGE 06141]